MLLLLFCCCCCCCCFVTLDARQIHPDPATDARPCNRHQKPNSMAIRLQPGLYKNTKGPCCCPSQVSGGTVKVEKCCCDGVVRPPAFLTTSLTIATCCVHLAHYTLTTRRPTVCDLADPLWTPNPTNVARRLVKKIREPRPCCS